MDTKKEVWQELEAVEHSHYGRRIAAYIVMPTPEHTDYKPGAYSRVVIVYPASDVGIVRVFVAPYDGTPMFKVSAGGYGYDRESAALRGATLRGYTFKDNGWGWRRELEDAGFYVLQAF